MTNYSIVSYMSNHVSDEKIAIGLIMFSDFKDPIYRISENKIDMACLINPSIGSFIRKVLNEESIFGFTKDMKICDELIRRHQTEQGILHYSSPRILNSDLNQNDFNYYFDKWILNKIS